MRQLFFILSGLCFVVVFFIVCQDKDSQTMTRPELATAGGSGEKLKVTIKSNDAPEVTYFLEATEWNGVQNIEGDKFYRIADDKISAFEAKLSEKRGGQVKSDKTKESGADLANYDSGNGIFAVATALCYANSSFGDCETTADNYYYNYKVHEHSYWGGGYEYYYSHVDSFSVWSDINTQFQSGANKMHCEASIERNNVYYILNPSPWTMLATAPNPGAKKDSIIVSTDIMCPPFCVETDTIWRFIAGDNALASDYCQY